MLCEECGLGGRAAATDPREAQRPHLSGHSAKVRKESSQEVSGNYFTFLHVILQHQARPSKNADDWRQVYRLIGSPVDMHIVRPAQ